MAIILHLDTTFISLRSFNVTIIIMSTTQLSHIPKFPFQMFRTLDPDCNGTLHSSRLDSISLVKYKTAFEYILNVTEQLSIERQRKDQEFEGKSQS